MRLARDDELMEFGIRMADDNWLWALFTIAAAFAQTLRNATQRELTGTLGMVGATHTRFLFGFPFALIFLTVVTAATGDDLPTPSLDYLPWILAGTLAQILATALMLAAMNERSFVVSIAYIKTEPVQVALFGLVFLGDAVTLPLAAAILIATAGVVLMSVRPGEAALTDHRPAFLGIAAGAMFALSAVGYRGAILSLDAPGYVIAATFTLAVALVIQAGLLTAYLLLRDPAVLQRMFAAWQPSLAAGFLGALASQFWFLAFALATAASVRTLALVEVLFAQAISTFFFRQLVSAREVLGIVLVVAGVALLLWAS
jgi:drug/metabolite transporter (DMT)-like permease